MDKNLELDDDGLIDDENVPVVTKPKRAKAKAGAKAKKTTKRDKHTTKRAAKRSGGGAKKARRPRRPAAATNGAKPKREPRRAAHKVPEAGSVFKATYKGKTYTMKVKAEGDGVVYVMGRQSYKSPTAAASAVLDRGRANGWAFWGIDTAS